MPPRKKTKKACVPRGSNSIDVLPDCVLEHILGFVPAPDAVRTCILARRWRHLWKSSTGLRINCTTGQPSFNNMPLQLVDHLLEHRGLAPLEICELTFCICGDDDDVLSLNRWIRHVLMCRVRTLELRSTYNLCFDLDPLISQHLTRLDLVSVMLNNRFCDLSTCPSLEHLVFDGCNLQYTEKITSESLKCLRIRNSFDSNRFHIFMYVPSLVSLRLDDHWCRTPVFETVPSLQEAFVNVSGACGDCCCEADHEDSDVEDDCFSCYNIENHNKCVLLEGLSQAVDLSLVAESKKIILEWDLKHWPQFNKFKTLLLNDYWCVAPDFHAIICILKHSPVLEKLTLVLFSKEPEHKMEIIGTLNPMQRSQVISEHLKAIKVQCEVVDKEVQKVLKFLCTLNITFTFL